MPRHLPVLLLAIRVLVSPQADERAGNGYQSVGDESGDRRERWWGVKFYLTDN
jgi:hypothetical protein